MQVIILEPKGIIWQGTSKEVTLPTEDGEIAVLDFHQPFLIKLKNGLVKSAEKNTLIKGGVAFMQSNELKVFVETQLKQK